MCGRREVGEGTSDHSKFGCMLVALVMRIVLLVSVFSVQPCHYERFTVALEVALCDDVDVTMLM